MQQDKKVNHLAVIMDGNGRWAKLRGQDRVRGHAEGAKAAISLVEACVEKGIKELTLYALSVENMQRDQKEVQFITNLLTQTLTEKQTSLRENGVCVRVIGDREIFDEKVQNVIRFVEQTTKKNTTLKLNIAFNYSGRWQIQEALHHACEYAERGDKQSQTEHFENHLSQGITHDPDLLIRTGGEKRLSNFMLWHLAYTELFFSDVLWPDFSIKHLDKTLSEFQARERRFGQVVDQQANCDVPQAYALESNS